MRVVGVDPGLGRCGYAVVDQDAGRTEAVTYGTIHTRGDEVAPRLAELAERFRAVVAETRPDCLAIERLFVNANVRTAMAVGQASGVVLLIAAEHDLPVTSYTPSQVKRTMAGVGSAPKEQVGYMVRAALGLAAVPTPADTADALAVALCHLHHLGMHAVSAAGGRAAGAIGAAPAEAWLARAAPTSPGLQRPAGQRQGRRR
jgi:crossover junction endodeoxyribonuclease RuvC